MEFIKSLINPLKMRKYRNMSIFISMLIFVLSIYLLMFSYRIKTNLQKEDFVQKNTLELLGVYELDSPDFDFSGITAGGYTIKDKKLTTSLNEEEVKSYQATYTKDSKKIAVNILFDPYDIREKEIKVILDDYYTKYDIKDPDRTVQNKGYYISNMLYAKMKNEPETDYDAYLETLHAKSLKELEEDGKNLTVFELYDIDQTEDAFDYILIYNPQYLVYAVEANSEGEQIAATVYYTEGKELNLSGVKSINEFGEATAMLIMDTYVLTMQNKQNLNLFLSILLLPFILVLILWLAYRRNGVLKTYKEYYNIAAICSIIPTLLIFAVSWVWVNVNIIHTALILIFYIFVLYRINSNPQEV